MDDTATIIAAASPPGASGRAIVRISGGATADLLSAQLAGRGFTAGVRRDRLRVGGRPLPVVVLSFEGPRSYTGEDAAEVQLPGNPVLVERVIDELIEAGRVRGHDVRRAGPGEFTARAWLAGRLSLTQAEGVAATIAARSDAELAAAAMLRGGVLGRLAAEIAEEVAGVLALVEAGIDFTDEEDVVPIAALELARRLGALRRRLDGHLARAVGSEQLQAIPWVVLAGAPNAGKSTLFNALLGRERAVTSAMAGTTRDALVEPLAIETAHGRAEVLLVDLAGEDRAAGELDELMQRGAAEALRRAELALRCVPVGAEAGAPRAGEIVVRTKADAGADTDAGTGGGADTGAGAGANITMRPGSAADRIRRGAHESEDPAGWPVRALEPVAAAGTVVVSARTGAGLDGLRRAIAERLAERAVSLSADALALHPRHEAAMRAASAHLAEAAALIGTHRGALPAPELIAAALRAALDQIAALAGEITPDEILGRIFSTFCVGK